MLGHGGADDIALLATGHDTLPDGTINPDWQPADNNPTEKSAPANPSDNYNF